MAESAPSVAPYARHTDDQLGLGPSSTFQTDSRARAGSSSGSGGGGASVLGHAGPSSHAPVDPEGGGAAQGSGAGAANPRPLLHRALSGRHQQQPHRQVHENAMQEAVAVSARSPLLLFLSLLWCAVELALASLCLVKGWDDPCDKPLRTWIIVFTCRLGVAVPLTIWRFRQARWAAAEVAMGRPDPSFAPEGEGEINSMQLSKKLTGWLKTLAFVWIIVAHFWYFQSETCRADNPWLAKYVLAQIILFYAGLCLPLLALLCICLCLPCALLFFHILAPRPGAKPDVINKLPKRVWAPGVVQPGDDAPSCSICMDEYKAGDELRTLPCQHEFHVPCVDRCPLCRKPLGGEEEHGEDDDAADQV